MPALANGPIVISYNGIEFPVETQSTVTERPIPDASGRTIKYVVYTISVKSILSSGDADQTTDSAMESLRKQLIAPGGELHYEGTGFGGIVVNAAGGSGERDVIWGPKPSLLKWSPKGQQAAEIEWTCEVALAPCDDVDYDNGVLEYVYGVTWSVDRSGYTIRTVKGSYTIPQTRDSVDDTTLARSADEIREDFVPPLLPGFRRASSLYELSDDKCKESFTVVDEEAGPNYPPQRVVEVSASHRVYINKAGTIGGQWTGVLNATYEVARGANRSLPYRSFLELFDDRRRAALDKPFEPPGKDPVKNFVLIQSLSLAEPEIYGRKCAEFQLKYTFLATLESVAEASGLWRPMPNDSSLLWQSSLKDNVFDSRGNARLEYDADSDAVMDLCHQPKVPQPQPPPFVDELEAFDPPFPPLKNEMPDPDASWMLYESRVVIEPIDQVYELKTLPVQKQPPDYGLTTGGQPDYGLTDGQKPGYGLVTGGGTSSFRTKGATPGQVGAGAKAVLSPPSPGDSIVQVRCPPSYYAYLIGRARRAGYPMDPPALLSVGGQPLAFANREGDGFQQRQLATLFGVPVYEAMWRLRYLVVGTPSGPTPIMGNPIPLA